MAMPRGRRQNSIICQSNSQPEKANRTILPNFYLFRQQYYPTTFNENNKQILLLFSKRETQISEFLFFLPIPRSVQTTDLESKETSQIQ